MAVDNIFISNKISIKSDKISYGSYNDFDPDGTPEQMCQFGELINSLQDSPYTKMVRTEECRLENWA